MANCKLIGGTICGTFGVGIVAFGVIWHLMLGEIVINCIISKQVEITEGSAVYDSWVKNPVAIKMQFWFYNWTNADSVLEQNGTIHQPKLVQVGPYTYYEFRKKDDIVLQQGDGIAYKEHQRFVFNRSESVGDESDQVTLPNIPLLAAITRLNGTFMWSAFHGMINNESYHEKAFRIYSTHSVGEYTFKGYNDALINFLTFFGEISILPNSRFAFMIQTNASDNAIYVVDRGSTDATKVNTFKSYNGNSTASPGYQPQCRQINGTDGTMFGTGTAKKKKLYMFQPDICRSTYVEQKKDKLLHGIKVNIYDVPDNLMRYGKEHEENSCFCKDGLTANCPANGLIDLRPCKDGVPVLASLANCYMCDQSIINQTNVMRPSKEEFDTYLAIEPTTGLTLEAQKRFQLNIHFQPNMDINEMKDMPDIVFPLFWANESSILTEELADAFKSAVLTPVKLLRMFPILCFVFGGGVILASSFMVLVGWRRSKEVQVSTFK